MRLSILRPFPPAKTADDIVERAAFVTILERRDMKLFEHLERLENAGHNLAGKHPRNNLAVVGGQTSEKQVDLMLIGK